jgi:chromosomal replication initiation ATPase DnaA
MDQNMQKPKSANGQLPLALPVEPNITREDLLESPSNKLAVDLVDCWPDWPSNIVVLAGPIGSGKTHLAKVWAGISNAEILLMSDLENHPDMAKDHSLVLEDAGATKLNEEALFHAINQARAHGHFLMITSRSFPSSWGIELPDLSSRLKLAHIVELQEPDDALLSALMFKLFADRQLSVSPAVIDYLVNRMERSMEIAGSLVEWLDKEGLARQRKINRAMANEALKALGIS